MKMRLFIVIIIMIISGSILLYLSTGKLLASDWKSMSPIFDGNAGNVKLHFEHCKGYDHITNWKGVTGAEKMKKNFKSKQWTKAEEVWTGYGIVTIYRWYFDCPEDAVLYPETNLVTGSMMFPGWANNSSELPKWADKAFVGDKTCWLSSDTLIFTKGKVLVRIDVNPPTLGKDYTQKIAENIVKKL